MGAWSVPLSLDCTCHELGHTWTPSCIKAALEVAYYGYSFGLKTYVPLYVVAALLRKRGLDYYRGKLILEILQSTVFLGTNAFGFVASFCVWRKLVGRFYFISSVYLPAVCAAGSAILLERKARRGLLAVYVSNVAADTAWRMLEYRGYVRNIPNGEVLLFSLVSAAYIYLYKQPGALSGATLSALKFILGSEEQLQALSTSSPQPPESRSPQRGRMGGKLGAVLVTLKRYWRPVWQPVERLPKHVSCRHGHSCVAYCLQGGAKMAGIGAALQLVLKFMTSLRRPRSIPSVLFKRDNLQLAAFLGSYTALCRAVSCILRWVRGRDSAVHGFLAGGVAGLSMMFYKSSTVTMYLASKLAELLYMKGASAGKLPSFYYGDVALYAVSTALLFHVVVFECHNLRPAYWRFLLNITNGRFALMNRTLLDSFGTEASKRYKGIPPPLVQK